MIKKFLHTSLMFTILANICQVSSAQISETADISYLVLIAQSDAPCNPDTFNIPGKITERKSPNGKYQYTMGEFSTYDAAHLYLYALKQYGASEARILPIKVDRERKGQPTDVKPAKAKLTIFRELRLRR